MPEQNRFKRQPRMRDPNDHADVMFPSAGQSIADELKEMRDRITVLESALQFYADTRNYNRVPMIGFEGNSPVEDDGGERARTMLYGREDNEE